MKPNIILVKISGEDRVGLSADFYAIIKSLDVRILDIGQSVIHNQMSQGMMLQLPANGDDAVIRQQLKYRANELKLKIKINDIGASDYQRWVSMGDDDRYTLTLLTREVSAEEIARVAHSVSEQGFSIHDITRLSGRVPFNQPISNEIKSCIEFSLSGSGTQPHSVRAELLKIASELDVDLSFQKDDAYRRSRRLVCFDMDSTLIDGEVIDLLAQYAGVENEVASITERAMLGELDFKESFKQRMALLKGLDIKILPEIATELRLMEGAECLVKNLKNYGYKTAILSGGFTYFGEHLQRRLGIDYVFANQLETEGNTLTGRVVEPVVDGQRKADLLHLLASQEGISTQQTIAVGDGANDLPMLSAAGLGIAFRAKPLVRETAKQSLSTHGLDSILYLLGFKDSDIERGL